MTFGATLQTNKICRTCLTQEGDLKSIFGVDGTGNGTPTEPAKLFEMLMSCASVQVTKGDGLPSRVCIQCVLYISRAYSFKQLCERSDATLRQLLGKGTEELDEPEPVPVEINPVTASGFQNTYEFTEVKLEPEEEIIEDDNWRSDDALNNLSTTENIEDVKKKHNVNKSPVSLNFQSTHEERLVENKLEPKEEITEDVNWRVDGLSDNFSNEINMTENIQPNTTNIGDVRTIASVKKWKEKKKNPPYACKECTQCFMTFSGLKVHSKTHSRKHIRKHRYICKACNQDYCSQSSLKRHMQVHYGPKQHLCSECGKGFTRPDNLTRHLRTHTSEKPVQCKTCGKKFARSFLLLKHMRTHTETTFVCTLCSKSFCKRTSFAVHMKTHSRRKDNVCPHCHVGFTTPKKLDDHQRTHTCD